MQRSGIEGNRIKHAARWNVWFRLVNRVLVGRRRTELQRVASMQRSGIEDHGIKHAARLNVWFALANRVLMRRRRTELQRVASMQRSGIEGNGHEARGAVERVVRAGQSRAGGTASNRTAPCQLSAR